MEGNRNQTNDSLRVLSALKQNVLKSVNVCSIAYVRDMCGMNTIEPRQKNGNWWANNTDLGLQVDLESGVVMNKPYIAENRNWCYKDRNGDEIDLGISLAETSFYRTCQLINKPNVNMDCFDLSYDLKNETTPLQNGSLVLILYTDEDSRDNLKRILFGDEPIEINDENVKHNLNYGIIIKKIMDTNDVGEQR